MADPRHEADKTPQRVMALCCYAALSVSVLLGGAGIVLIPWGLNLLYGRSYAAAGAAVAVALATAVAHMGTAPAANRLTIVSIRATAAINTIWASFVGVAATLVLLHGGAAWRAMAIFFAAHVLSSVLTLGVLKRRDHMPNGLLPLFGFSTVTIGGLAALSLWRGASGDTGPLTAAMGLLLGAMTLGLYRFGFHYAWLPPRGLVQRALGNVLGRIGWGVSRV